MTKESHPPARPETSLRSYLSRRNKAGKICKLQNYLAAVYGQSIRSFDFYSRRNNSLISESDFVSLVFRMGQSVLFYGSQRVLFDSKIWHETYDTVFNGRDEQSEMRKLTSFYPCGWLQSWCSPFFLGGSEKDFGDINVLSVWVYFKSDAYLILWHHLLTSKIAVSVMAPEWYIHNSEISDLNSLFSWKFSCTGKGNNWHQSCNGWFGVSLFHFSYFGKLDPL